MAIAFFCLILLSFQDRSSEKPAPAPSGPNQGPNLLLPASLQAQLRQYQERDDLTAWIYTQIQWVVKSPANRASLLVQATEKAWRSAHSNEEIQAWQDLLSNEGYAWLMSGDIVHSTDAYTAAFQWARQHKELADEVLLLENILKPLGNNYIRLGDYEQALFIHRKALAIAASLDDKDALAGTYSNLANTASNMGLPELSLDYCRQGLKVVNNHSALCGLLLSEQADACEQLQRDNAARASIRKSIAVLEQATAGKHTSPDAGYWLLMAYQQAGDIYSQQPVPALQFYSKALSLQNSLSRQHGAIRKRERAKLFQRLGALYVRSGQPIRATYWLDECLSVLVPGKRTGALQETDLYAENTLLDLLFTFAGLYEGQNHTDEALHLYSLCFATEKKLRKELITGSSREQSVSDSRLRYETAIHTAWKAWERTGQSKYQQAILEFMESSKSQLLLEEVLQQQQIHPVTRIGNPSSQDSSRTFASGAGNRDSLTSRIRLLERALVYYRKEALQTGNSDSIANLNAAQEKQTEWDLAQLRKKAGAGEAASADRKATGQTDATKPSRAATTGKSPTLPSDISTFLPVVLPHGQIVRSFFAGAASLYVVECDRSGIVFTEQLPLDSKKQDSILAFIHTYFEQGANAMINHPGDYYRQAYTIYRQLFGNHPLQPGKEYILLPDGPLSLLPVEALVTTPNNPPSPEKWPFVIRQSLISYAWSLLTLQNQVLTPANSSGVAGFFLSGNQDQGKSPLLKAVVREKEGIAAIVKEGSWYTDEQATTTTFRKALEGAALLHISSHAYTKKDALEAPHIELFNEPFYLFELKGLEHHPSLVVLSACRTGDGRMVTGEGVQSLARAFTAGGANAVIAGWWNVNDEAAAQLMQGFYSTLVVEQGPGKSTAGSECCNAAQALRTSKLNWLDAPEVSYVHKLPYYWAALNYQGNPQPLQTSTLSAPAGRRTSPWWWSLLILPVLFVLLTRSRR